ncbi:hypothetical protein EW145_g5989 [Phellinidium pouzarii]|uniref:Man1/Src1 C-terminal domain-containing protein n=1 Tax=Phellinidium pouzarii TaxID=167371 RepID=A0A4S4KZB7_9AGAM|nr:hypothetical protein EW145_g5989 [Phellinidium pouzarii]
MSRPTTSQIIALGDYLKPDFDAKSLTIPHLIGILAYHQVQYPSQHNKAKLIDIFNGEIKVNSARLRKQRLERQETLASEDGIVDGVTGVPIVPPPQFVRRSSRRLSREPSLEPTRSEPPKRRRASAEPTVGRTTRKSTVKPVPVISEESEGEEEERPDPEPHPKAGKRKGSETAGSSRRVSQKFGPGTDDSGWEDNNIFQSGAESSSPIRPPKAKTSRKSNLRKSRNSMSAPPESPTRSSPVPVFSPSQSNFNFNPAPPSAVNRPHSRPFFPKAGAVIDLWMFYDTHCLADVSAEIVLEEDEEENEQFGEDGLHGDEEEGEYEDEDDPITEDAQTVEVAQRIADGGTVVRRQAGKASSSSIPIWLRIFMTITVFVLSGIAGQYKLEAAPIGFCDAGTSSNDVLVNLQSKRLELEGCHAQHEGNDSLDACPPLPLISLPHPDTCTPCPAHAVCSRFSVRCDEGYILKPHPLSLIPYASVMADGLPGFGPIAFPPKCIDDELRKKNIGALGKRIDSTLEEVRGKRLCAGIDATKSIDGGEARMWGYRADELQDLLKKKYVRDGDKSVDEFNKLYWEAIEQLKKYGRLVESRDSEQRLYIASDHASMSWSCQAIVASRQSWAEWRRSVFGMVGLFMLGLYGKARIAVRREESRRVADLVQIALDTLRNQEMNYHIDPVTTPQPYLSSLQLRDVILQDEHSIPVRRRLWDRVERVVEGNANVRANLEELRGGEEARVWSWVGSSGLLSPAKKRASPVSVTISGDARGWASERSPRKDCLIICCNDTAGS